VSFPASYKIVLIGFMGSGKTTIAKMLSKRLGIKWVDIDSLVEKEVGITIPEIFERYGERFFREKEKEKLKEVLKSKEDMVISTGGGLPALENSMDLINRFSVSIYLESSFDALWERISKDSYRPLVKLGRKKLKEIFEQRVPFYRKAKFSVRTDKLSPEETVEEVLRILRSGEVI